MPAEFNSDRVIFYPPTDLACGMFRERAAELLNNPPSKIDDINQAIELWQCALTASRHPTMFEIDDEDLKKAASFAEKSAFGYVGRAIQQKPLRDVFGAVELQYTTQFWELLAKTNSYNRITDEDIVEVADLFPSAINDLLLHKPLVDKFPQALRMVLMSHESLSAQLIIGAFGSKNIHMRNLYLPSCLTDADIDSIMLSFLQEEDPNLNYVRVLAAWPSSGKQHYKPSNDVLVTAQKRSKELNERIFKDGTGMHHAIGVTYSPSQKACKGMQREDDGFTYVYSTQWLSEYTDSATILNNFIYIFDLMNADTRLLSFPAHRHERSTLLDTLGIHAADEYHSSIGFDLRNTQALLAVFSYSLLLEECGCRLENAISWFFNAYIEEEFDIKGFSISLPTKETTWLDKCKSIGPEIERVLTAYKLYVSKGCIDDAYFPLMPFKQFSDVGSLIQSKYVIEGPKFMECSYTLFSDQSALAFSEKHKSADQQFFSMMVSEHVVRGDFPDVFHGVIDQLLDNGLITESEKGQLLPTSEACALAKVWNDGAIPRYLLSEEDAAIAYELVKTGKLSTCDSLFTPDESDYMNFVFNDALFSNPWALRNKYDHGSFSVGDPNSKDIHEDYCRLLVILIGILLKINDELCFVTGKGGLEDFVDWPLYDESILDVARSFLD